MNHNDIRHKLSEYLDGSVTAEEKSSIEKHLKSCATCSDALNELRKTVEHIKAVEEVEPPAWMTQKIMASVRSEAEQKKSILQRLFFPLSIKLPIQAVVVLFLAVTVFSLNRSMEPQKPHETPEVKFAARKEAPPAPAAKGEQKKAMDAFSSEKSVPQSPGYKALDMKPEYEKPAPPVSLGRADAPAEQRPEAESRAAAPLAEKRKAMPFAGPIANDAARKGSAAKLYQGTWKFTEEEEKLTITSSDGRLRGVYYGLELAGEHGRFYYVTELTNLKIDNEGNISFDIPERELITEPVRTLAEAREMGMSEDKKAGFTRDVIHMKGSMKSGYLEFECRSDSDSCYDKTMKFKRID